jgi:GcrA cell cycle regulator
MRSRALEFVREFPSDLAGQRLDFCAKNTAGDFLMTWTDERVETLKQLWKDGLSASQIAARLGSVTRNAVIGKVHRLGLAGRATKTRVATRRVRRAPNQPNALNQARRVPQKARFQASGNPALRELYAQPEPVQHIEELVIPMNERKYIQTLTESCCRWPIGDPQLAEFHFCGKKKVNGLPYCDHHARRAFQPPQTRRRDMGGISTPAHVKAPSETEDA